MEALATDAMIPALVAALAPATVAEAVAVADAAAVDPTADCDAATAMVCVVVVAPLSGKGGKELGRETKQ